MDREEIRDQINRILRSESFADKGQLKRLLEFLFQNMASQTTLKPSRIIRELWPEENATKGSTDVATEMNRLRRAVDSYYSTEGHSDPVTISFPNRSKPGAEGGRKLGGSSQIPANRCRSRWFSNIRQFRQRARIRHRCQLSQAATVEG